MTSYGLGGSQRRDRPPGQLGPPYRPHWRHQYNTTIAPRQKGAPRSTVQHFPAWTLAAVGVDASQMPRARKSMENTLQIGVRHHVPGSRGSTTDRAATLGVLNRSPARICATVSICMRGYFTPSTSRSRGGCYGFRRRASLRDRDEDPGGGRRNGPGTEPRARGATRPRFQPAPSPPSASPLSVSGATSGERGSAGSTGPPERAPRGLRRRGGPSMIRPKR